MSLVKISLEQFASFEAWMEAYLKLATRRPGDNYADLITSVYRCRQRAMTLLTGAKYPSADKEDQARFEAELEAMLRNVATTGRATAPKAIKLPTSKPVVDDDHDDIA